MTRKVAILISGGGSNMVELVRSMTGDHPGRPCLVMSNRPGAGGLARAEALGVPTAVVDHTKFTSRESFEAQLSQEIAKSEADLICLAGFMRVLTEGFVADHAGRMLNIHPSLLPKYRGLDTHARAIAAGDDWHGCSVHEVTAELDGGPILGQARLRIAPDDTPETLASRVLKLEHRLYPLVMRRFLEGKREPILLD